MTVLAIDGIPYRTHLDALPDAAMLSRRFLAQLIDLWGIAGDAGENAVQLVSELAANAVEATGRLVGPGWGGPAGHLRFIVVRARVSVSQLRVEVLDHNPRWPVLRQVNASFERGRGLFLVDALADEWGCEPAPGPPLARPGKAVWFALNLTEPPRPRNALPAQMPIEPDEVITSPRPAAPARPPLRMAEPLPAIAAQQPEGLPPLKRRVRTRPESRTALTAVPMENPQPAPSACLASAVIVRRLEAALTSIETRAA